MADRWNEEPVTRWSDEEDATQWRSRGRWPQNAYGRRGRRGRGRRRGQGPRNQPEGGGYDYSEEHGGQWQGFEPERRDYGQGYRPRYTYTEEDERDYQAGYRYGAEHEGQWEGYEPVRRDYGWHRGPSYDPTYENTWARQGYPDYEGEESSYAQPWLRPGPHTGKGPKDWQRSDESIFEDACERLTQHGNVDASNIEVSVDGSEITLEGTVENRRQKRMAEDALEAIRGVWDIHNRLTIPRGEES